MLRHLDRLAAILVALFGLLHLYVGRAVFTDPTNPRIWFAAGGFLLVTTGLANLAAGLVGHADFREKVPAPILHSAAALSGNLALLILGALLAKGDPGLLREPQTIALLAIGAFLSVMRVREMMRR